MIEAKIICDSIGEHSPRLITFLTRYPKFIHAEHMRHRAGSYCVSSSRAIPVLKNLEEVRNDELRAVPIWWGREQKGMASGEELSDKGEWVGSRHRLSPLEQMKSEWANAALSAAKYAEGMARFGVHKSIVNRLLEPFLHVNCLMTIAEPGLLNFFGLRLDKSAQPEIRVLAEAMWREWNEGNPKKLEPGQWHLPFVEDENDIGLSIPHDLKDRGWTENLLKTARMVSVARCARLSYSSFETNKKSTVVEDLKLYDRLIGSCPIHASPAEHQATPDNYIEKWTGQIEHGYWENPTLTGNLGPGWVQYRKTLPGESIAPLPEGYSHG